MDIAALATQASAAAMMNQYSTAVLAKTLDAMETQGDAIVRMMEQSVEPHLGQSVDIRL